MRAPSVVHWRRQFASRLRDRRRRALVLLGVGCVHKADLEERRGMLSSSTMAAIDSALRDVLALH